jgi:hypothetical protein
MSYYSNQFPSFSASIDPFALFPQFYVLSYITMKLKEMIEERLAVDKAKRQLQREQQDAQLASIQAIRDEAAQEQENQAMVELQIRNESIQPPANYAGLKASKRKSKGTLFNWFM